MAQPLEVTAPRVRRTPIDACLEWIKAHQIALVLAIVALCIRLFGLTSYSFNGDEYNTIAEARHVGLNWMSPIYYAVLHVWIMLGASEMAMRLPSVLYDTATVVVLYSLGRQLSGSRMALALGTVAATSPFLIYHAQDARFYSFFILATSLFLLATIRLIEQPARASKLAVGLAAAILLLSHFLGLLAIITQAASALVAAPIRWTKAKRAFAIILLFMACFALPLVPPVQRGMWAFYQAFAHTTSASEPVIVPISPINVAKVGLAIFVFGFGYHVYPLWWFLTIPTIALTSVLLVIGTLQLARKTNWGALPAFFGITLLGAYLVLDPIGGRLASGIAPRHVAFIWPIYALVLAVGLASLAPRWFYALLSLLVALNIAALCPRWAHEWSYTGLLDYRAAAEFASSHANTSTIILNDGRSQEPIDVYFPAGVPHKNFWSYTQGASIDDLLAYQRIIVVSNDYQPARRQEIDTVLARLADRYTITAGRVEYPLFEYMLDRKPAGQSGFSIDPRTGQVHQPAGIYGLEFQDLRLPVTLEASGIPLSISGALSISSGIGQREAALPLASAPAARRLILVSSVAQATGITPGQQIAEIQVEFADGTSRTLPLRYGVEVQDWSHTCDAQASCRTVYQWHKRVALVGQQSYPGAWRDFEAEMHAVELALPAASPIARLTFHYTHTSGSLYVWALATAR